MRFFVLVTMITTLLFATGAFAGSDMSAPGIKVPTYDAPANKDGGVDFAGKFVNVNGWMTVDKIPSAMDSDLRRGCTLIMNQYDAATQRRFVERLRGVGIPVGDLIDFCVERGATFYAMGLAGDQEMFKRVLDNDAGKMSPYIRKQFECSVERLSNYKYLGFPMAMTIAFHAGENKDLRLEHFYDDRSNEISHFKAGVIEMCPQVKWEPIDDYLKKNPVAQKKDTEREGYLDGYKQQCGGYGTFGDHDNNIARLDCWTKLVEKESKKVKGKKLDALYEGMDMARNTYLGTLYITEGLYEKYAVKTGKVSTQGSMVSRLQMLVDDKPFFSVNISGDSTDYRYYLTEARRFDSKVAPADELKTLNWYLYQFRFAFAPGEAYGLYPNRFLLPLYHNVQAGGKDMALLTKMQRIDAKRSEILVMKDAKDGLAFKKVKTADIENFVKYRGGKE